MEDSAKDMGDYEKYLRVAEEWEAEFARNRARYGPKIHCRKGCSDCCGQMFQITELEAAYISHEVKGLPEARQAALKERARIYLEKRRGLLGRQGVEEAWGSLPPPGLRLACPALEDGACSIYEHRPMICRKYGIPLYNPKKPDRIFACELNFLRGEEIQDDQLVQIHTGLYQRWADVQADYNDQGGRRDAKPLTVARAILEDFEPYLPSGTEAGGKKRVTSDQ